MKWIILSLVVALLLVGCTQNNANNTANPQNPAGGTGTGDGTGNTAGGNNAGTGNTGGTNAASQFQNLFSGTAEYRASYSVSASSELQISSYTMYLKGGDRMRLDMTATTDDGTVQSRIWKLPTKMVMCSTQQGQAEQCIEVTQFQSYTTDPRDVAADTTGLTITPLPPRTIAGETGSCFKVMGTQRGQTIDSEFCATSDGILLYSKSISQGQTFEMSATSVTRTVTEADMTPPEGAQNPWEDIDLPQGYEYPDGYDPSDYQ